jgi:hypothetical protein
MKNILFALLTLLACKTQAQNPPLIYDNNAQVRQVGNFTSIKISSAIDLYLTQSDNCQVAVSATKNEMRERIQTTVEGNTLVIKLENNNGWSGWNSWGNYKMKAYVSVKELNALMGSGATTIRLLSKVATQKLQIKLSGASDFDGDIEAGTLDLNISGASNYKGQLNANSFILEASGASQCSIKGAVDDMSLELSGASDAKLFDLYSKGAIVNTSGASSAHIQVSQLLKARASGGSDIIYKGDAALKDMNKSGGANIRHKD